MTEMYYLENMTQLQLLELRGSIVTSRGETLCANTFFANRVVNIWNSLHNDFVLCDTVNKLNPISINTGNSETGGFLYDKPKANTRHLLV